MIDPSKLINPVFVEAYSKIMNNEFKFTHLWLTGGRGCIDEDTLISTPYRDVKVKDFKGGKILSYDGKDVITAFACKPIKYPAEDLYTVKTETREITVTANHRFLTQRGWVKTADCRVGDTFLTLSNDAFEQPQEVYVSLRESIWDISLSKCREDVLHCFHILLGYLYHYWQDYRQYDGQPLSEEETYLDVLQQLTDEQQHNRRVLKQKGDLDIFYIYDLSCLFSYHLSNLAFLLKSEGQNYKVQENDNGDISSVLLSVSYQLSQLSHGNSSLDELTRKLAKLLLSLYSEKHQDEILQIISNILVSYVRDNSYSDSFKSCNHNRHYMKQEKILQVRFCTHAPFYDLFVPFFNCYFGNGILNHNSGKSSFAGFLIPTLLMRDASWHKSGYIPNELLSNAVILRKYGNTLRESVLEQIGSAINMLGVNDYWDRSLNPMQFIYKPTGQKIIFRGLDDATKTKSIKVEKGRISVVWYEELEEFNGIEEIRKANQSFIRGGGTISENQVNINPLILYSYNPPRTMSSWVNSESLKKVPSRYVLKSDYRTMPVDWLGKEFLKEALELRDTDLMSYRHEYLGEVVGVEGTIFKNIKGRRIKDVEVRGFRNCLQGLDWGFGHPAAFTQSFYDYKKGDLYIFGEVVQQGLTNPELAAQIKKLTKGDKRTQIIADCEDRKSIQEFRRMGFNIIGCRKKRGVKGEMYGIKWLQKLNNIFIDEERCPETYKAFCGYAYKKDREGYFTDNLPDKGEDPIDSVRYALQSFIYPPTFSARK